MLPALTRLSSRLVFCLLWLRLVCSHCLWIWALAMNSLGGYIIFQMPGSYVDFSCTLNRFLRVHLSLLDFIVNKCTLILHSGTSIRAIPLFKRHCSAHAFTPLIDIVAWSSGSWCIPQPEQHNSVHKFSAGSKSQLCTCHLPWFRWDDRHS